MQKGGQVVIETNEMFSLFHIDNSMRKKAEIILSLSPSLSEKEFLRMHVVG